MISPTVVEHCTRFILQKFAEEAHFKITELTAAEGMLVVAGGFYE